MDVYRTEEEQVAALEQWWRENAVRVVVAVLLAVATYGGWWWWQKTERENAHQAAALYQGLMKSLQETGQEGQAAADAAERMRKTGESLIADHGDSVYAQYAAMMLAAQAVEKDDYVAAEKYLRTALAVDSGESTTAIITERLARVLSAQGRHDPALALLTGKVPEAMLTGRENVRGDILMAAGKRKEAADAWRKAQEAARDDDPLRPLLGLKLDYVAGE